jgi:D-aminopeptidase
MAAAGGRDLIGWDTHGTKMLMAFSLANEIRMKEGSHKKMQMLFGLFFLDTAGRKKYLDFQ